AIETERAAKRDLLDIRDRDCPGAIPVLQSKELWCQCRLAVRRDRQPVLVREVTHPGTVVFERRTTEDGRGHRQVTAENIPAFGADRAERQPTGSRWNALDRNVDGTLQQCLERHLSKCGFRTHRSFLMRDP